MKFKFSFLLVLLVCLICTPTYGAKATEGPYWIPLYEEESRLVYIDQQDFHSNLEKRKSKDEVYRVTCWIRQETIVPSSFFEYQLLVEKDEKTNVARFKTLKSRFLSSDGEVLTAENQTGWVRVHSDDSMEPLIQEIWKYDRTRKK